MNEQDGNKVQWRHVTDRIVVYHEHRGQSHAEAHLIRSKPLIDEAQVSK